MIAVRPNRPTALPFLPPRPTIGNMRKAVHECRGCELYKHALQAVFSEGPRDASLMFVGEQPGDQEDKQGRPFVGPAGRMLDRALAEAGIDRQAVYLTNAVKHFKNEPRGKRRIHGKPNSREVNACRPWLDAELELLHPRMLVALGATAAQALFGRDFRVTTRRGQPFEHELAPWCMATVHPSSLLRAPDAEARAKAWTAFQRDFAVIAREFLVARRPGKKARN